MSRVIAIDGGIPSPIDEDGTSTVKFIPFQRAQDGTGSVTVRMRKTESSDLDAVIRLLQGSRVISTQLVTLTESDQDYTLNLTVQEIQSIATPSACNVEGVTVEISAVSNIINACCGVPIPSVLHATYENNNNCGEISGEVELTYDSLSDRWTGSGTLCGAPIDMVLSCDQITGNWRVEASGGPCLDGIPIVGPAISCSPFQVSCKPVAAAPDDCPCCDGAPQFPQSFRGLITE